MANQTSTLTIRLQDDVTKPARSVAQALGDTERKMKEVGKALAGSGTTDRLSSSLTKLGLSAKNVEAVGAAFKTYAASAKLAANASDWTRAQAAGVRRWETQTISALKAVQREEAAYLRSQRRMVERGRGGVGGHGEGMSGRQMAVGIAGGYIAHETAHFAHRSLETYREFDKERRFGKAVMGISDDDQASLIRQAIHMGATTKFNDIQVLEAQRELAARGLKKDQILGVMGAAGDLGQSMDLTLPDAVKQMEGAIFGFKKNISTTADAMAAARQTADVQVRAAKISGMTPEDIQQVYKYGATPARMSGMSEQFLLAFGGISKKANMGGDEAGVAFRALMSAGQSPTRGAKEALLANGLDFKNYQSKIGHIDVDPFSRNVAAQYGVKLNRSAQTALAKVFSDPKVLNDPALFTPAVTKVLGGVLHGKDAKSLKSIAGMANRFRSASGGGVDMNAFMADLMLKLPNNIKLANAIFGAKQGARIANALGDPQVLKAMKEILTEHSDGYAKKIADERMAGFDGAVSRFEGAVLNLETAVGRSFDANGKGGLLTDVTSKAGAFVQSLAEAPPQLQRLAAEAGAAAAIFAGLKGAEALMGGFGLKGSAVALTGAAEALSAAAGKQAIASGIPGLPGGGATPGKKSFASRMGKVAKGTMIVGTTIEAAIEIASYLNENPEALKPASDAVHRAVPQLPGSGKVVGDDLGLPGMDGPSTPDQPASPFGDLSGVGGIRAKAAEAKAALDSVNGTTVAPVFDGASLDAGLAKANALAAALSNLSGLAAGVGAAVAGIKAPPSIGALNRGSFQSSGDPGR